MELQSKCSVGLVSVDTYYYLGDMLRAGWSEGEAVIALITLIICN